MSDTYVIKLRNKLNNIYRLKGLNEYFKTYDGLSNVQKMLVNNMSKNPSWWNKLFNNIPKRRQDKKALRKVVVTYNSKCDKFPLEEENFEFSVNRKPNIYYW